MAQLVKVVDGLAIGSTKVVDGLAIASVKTVMGLDNTSSGVPTGNAFTFQGAAADDSGGTSITLTYSPTVGRLVFAQAKWEVGGDITGIATNASAEAFTLLGSGRCAHNNGDLFTRNGYKVIANSGATTITFTWTGTSNFNRARIVEFSVAGGTIALDVSIIPVTPNTSGTSFTTSGGGTLTSGAQNCLAICTYGEYASGVPTSTQIGGAAATVYPNNTTNGSTQLWYQTPSSQLVAASGTGTTPNDAWIGELFSFISL